MDKQLTHIEIPNLLETIIDQHEIIASHEDTIPQIEIDILLSNVRKLYELYRNLEKTSGSLPSVRKIIKKQPKQVMPNLFEDLFTETPAIVGDRQEIEEQYTEPANIVYATAGAAISAVPEVQQEVEEEQVMEEISAEESILIEALHPTQKAEDPIVENKQVTRILEEIEVETPDFEVGPEDVETEAHTTVANSEPLPVITQEVKETLHDKILHSATDEAILADKLKKQPIADLRSAIGINEKFLFINEIFDADGVAYSNSIDFINQCKSYAEAKYYMESILKPRFHWTLDNKRVTDFLALVERRFL